MVKTLGTIMKNQMPATSGIIKSAPPSMLSPDSEARIKEIQTICGDSFSDLLVRFAPDRQMQVCKDLESVYAGSYPSLSEINMTYGDNSAAEWLIYQLTFLGLYAGVKEKFTEDDLYYFLDVIGEYYVDLLEKTESEDEVDIDIDAVAEYIAKKARKEKMGDFDPEDLRWVVDGELEYGESLEN